MAAKTFDEFWKILEVPHSRQGDDYVFIKELSEVVWKAAIKAAEEKFTSANIQSEEIPGTICYQCTVCGEHFDDAGIATLHAVGCQ
jgi:hypothetical protein